MKQMKFRSPSVDALLREAGVHDPEEAVRHRVRELLGRGRQRGWAGPPFDLEALADVLGIEVRTDMTGTVEDGMLVADAAQRLTIIYNPAKFSGRKNYTIGHELTHTVFPDRFDRPHFRCGSGGQDPELEHLCDVGASELLMPYPEFRDDLREVGVSLRSVDALARRYETSREATVRRMVHANLLPCAVIFLSLRNKPRDAPGAEPRLRIDAWTPSGSFPQVFFPPHKSAPDDSSGYALLFQETRGLVSSSDQEEWGVGGIPPCRSEAMWLRLPLDGGGRMAMLLFPIPPAGPFEKPKMP
jgi:Zn-dependent peptidase ImmA (M78 family)